MIDEKLVEYVSITDKEALGALLLLSRTEGIIPALGIGPRDRPCDEDRIHDAKVTKYRCESFREGRQRFGDGDEGDEDVMGIAQDGLTK